MTTRAMSKDLPEPRHPFARWGAGAIIGVWALSVQYFPDPWNKVGAILAPGVGYIFGQAMDLLISRVSIANYKKKLKSNLQENNRSEESLMKERQNVLSYGADNQIIAKIDAAILSLREERITIFRSLAKVDGSIEGDGVAQTTKRKPNSAKAPRQDRSVSIRERTDSITIVTGDGNSVVTQDRGKFS